MSIGLGLGGLVIAVVVIFVAIRVVKSIVKMFFVGVVVLLMLGAWFAYSLGYFR